MDGSTIQNIAYQYAPNWEWQGDDGIYVPYESSVALKLEKVPLGGVEGPKLRKINEP